MRDAVKGEILGTFQTHAGFFLPFSLYFFYFPPLNDNVLILPSLPADPFKLLVVIHLILYIPVDFIVLRHQFNLIFSINDPTKELVAEVSNYDLKFLTENALHIGVSVSLLSIAVMIVLLLNYCGVHNDVAFDKILNFSGALAGGLFLSIL